MSAKEKLSSRISDISLATDAIAAIVAQLVDSESIPAGKMAYAAADHLRRLSVDLDEVEVEVAKMEEQSAKQDFGMEKTS